VLSLFSGIIMPLYILKLATILYLSPTFDVQLSSN